MQSTSVGNQNNSPQPRLTGTAPVRAIEAHIADLDEAAAKFNDLVEMNRNLYGHLKEQATADLLLGSMCCAQAFAEGCFERAEELKKTISEIQSNNVIELRVASG